MPVSSTAFRGARLVVSIGAPPLVLAVTGYFYGAHDTRDLDPSEVSRAQRSLEKLDGGQPCTSTNTSASASASSSDRSHLPSTLHRHLDNLELSGVTLIRSVLASEEAARWDSTVDRELRRQDGACIVPAGVAIGRTHCRLKKRDRRGRGDGLFEALSSVANNEAAIAHKSAADTTSTSSTVSLREIAREYFASHGIAHKTADTGKHVSTSTSTSSTVSLRDIAREYFASHGIGEGSYGMTQLQLLDAAPKSTNQVWHRDNVHPGLTALIALNDVGAKGPTEILLGSHLSEKELQVLAQKNKDTSAAEDGTLLELDPLPRILLAAIQSGDAMLYDARVLHRGRGYGNNDNKPESEHRPVLVIRWDKHTTPAPGTAIVGTMQAKWKGEMLAFALWVRAMILQDRWSS